MNKSVFDSLTSRQSDSAAQQLQISDPQEHLVAVAEAHDMLSFLRSSIHELSYQREDRSASFYRGLSLCIEVVQKQLSQGLECSEKQE